MKILFISFGLLLFLFSCQDRKTKVKDNVVLEKEVVPEQNIEPEAIEPEAKKNVSAFPYLDSDTAMEFFLDYDKENKENKVRLETTFGTIDILLFEETKFHRSNFIFLTKQGYFEDTQFYRIVNNFIIQAGNSDDVKISNKREAIGKYLLPTDTKRGFRHHRGVVSMPSSEIENPYKLASPYEFFIVQSPNGAYHLDGDYTIFGKVIDGMDVVDKIAAQKTDGNEWPLHNIYITNAEIID